MLYYKMKYYNQNDLMFVFGIIVIGYFTLRYLMTRTLVEGQEGTADVCDERGYCTAKPITKTVVMQSQFGSGSPSPRRR